MLKKVKDERLPYRKYVEKFVSFPTVVISKWGIVLFIAGALVITITWTALLFKNLK